MATSHENIQLCQEIISTLKDRLDLPSDGQKLLAGNFDFHNLNTRGCVEQEFNIVQSEESGKPPIWEFVNSWTIRVSADQGDKRRGPHFGYEVWSKTQPKKVTGHLDMPNGVILCFNRGERPSQRKEDTFDKRYIAPGDKIKRNVEYRIRSTAYFDKEAH